MDKSTIKQEIIKYLESQGPKSKSKIEDYIRENLGTNGDTTSRRIRELVASGILTKTQKEFEGKKYWKYRVVEEELEQEEFDCTVCCRPIFVCKCD
mgnify:CR=1 FL=1